MPEALGSRLSGGVRTEIARKSQAIAEDVERQWHAGTIHPADAWAQVHAFQVQVNALLEECLILVTGAAARASLVVSVAPSDTGVDDWFPVADALVDELVARTPIAGWDAFTVLGVAESFRYVSRLIQLRFPRPAVWDVPSVAHELGHYLARTLAEFRNGRMQNLVDELHANLGGTDTTRRYWVEELFADAFASYALGPAYGFTCLTFGFDPLLANAATGTHPPSSARVNLVTDVLRLLDDSDVNWLADAMDALWTDLVTVSEAEPKEEGAPIVPDMWGKKITDLLTGHLTASKYSSWKEADRLSLDLRPQNAGSETTLSDVVNAAWLARMRTDNGLEVDKAAREALAVARALQ